MEILVIGGTGFIGTRLCRELDNRGHGVTALARNPGEADLPEGVEAVRGDVTDYDSIAPAFEGKDAAVNLVALSPLKEPRGGERMHEAVHRDGTENCVRAAEEHGVERFLQQSSVLADPEAPTAYLRAKGEAEGIVRDSDLEWTILRPTVVFGEGGEFVPFVKTVAPPYVTPLPGGGETRMQVIWVGDLVPMMADAIEDDAHVGETYEIGGPDRPTLAEIARLIHRSEGRSATVIPIPMALAGVGMTVGGAIPGFPFGPDQYRSLRMDLVVSENDVDAFGADPDDLTTLSEYLGIEA